MKSYDTQYPRNYKELKELIGEDVGNDAFVDQAFLGEIYIGGGQSVHTKDTKLKSVMRGQWSKRIDPKLHPRPVKLH